MIFDVKEGTLPSGLEVKVRELKTAEAAILRHSDKDMYERFTAILDSAVTYIDDSGIEVPFNTMERYNVDIAAALVMLRMVTFDEHFRFEIECANSDCNFGKQSTGSDAEYHQLLLSDNLFPHFSDEVHNGRYILNISENRKVIMRVAQGKDAKQFNKLERDSDDIMTDKMIYLSEGIIIEESAEIASKNDSNFSSSKVKVDKVYRVRPLVADELRVKDVSLFQLSDTKINTDMAKIEFHERCSLCGGQLVNSMTKTTHIPLFLMVFFSVSS